MAVPHPRRPAGNRSFASIPPLKRIEVIGLSPQKAAGTVVEHLTSSEELAQSDLWCHCLPLPQIFRVAYRPNPNFTGRFEALGDLIRSLRVGTTTAITAVAGMGGMGKATLAAEYCHRFGGRYAEFLVDPCGARTSVARRFAGARTKARP
jgi:hypothetical protein